MNSTGRRITSFVILALLVVTCWYFASLIPEVQAGYDKMTQASVEQWDSLTGSVDEALDTTYPQDQEEVLDD